MLNAHYRSPLNFSADLMEAAKNSLERILEAAASSATVETMGRQRILQRKSLRFSKRQKVLLPNLKRPWMMILIQQMRLRQFFELVKFANTNVDENSSKEFAGGLYEELF